MAGRRSSPPRRRLAGRGEDVRSGPAAARGVEVPGRNRDEAEAGRIRGVVAGVGCSHPRDAGEGERRSRRRRTGFARS